MKAPNWAKTKHYVEENVQNPLDHIQVNHEILTKDALEWSVSTVDLGNLGRLTPDVFREDNDAGWVVQCVTCAPSFLQLAQSP